MCTCSVELLPLLLKSVYNNLWNQDILPPSSVPTVPELERFHWSWNYNIFWEVKRKHLPLLVGRFASRHEQCAVYKRISFLYKELTLVCIQFPGYCSSKGEVKHDNEITRSTRSQESLWGHHYLVPPPGHTFLCTCTIVHHIVNTGDTYRVIVSVYSGPLQIMLLTLSFFGFGVLKLV